MTRDEVIRMAEEAKIDVHTAFGVADDALMRFAAAAYEKGAAAEREACLKLAEDHLCGFCVSDLAAAIRAREAKWMNT
jgi:hypothetical protein